jgi:hypothetical protein
MAHKTLLFRVDSEIESLVVAVPWTPALVALIEKRRKAVAVLAEGDDGFHRAFWFWYGMDIYTLTEELEELLEGHEDGTPLLVDDPPLNEDKLERTDVERMGVDDKDVIFKFYLKYTNDELETATVSFDDDELFQKS